MYPAPQLGEVSHGIGTGADMDMRLSALIARLIVARRERGLSGNAVSERTGVARGTRVGSGRRAGICVV